VSLRAKLWLHAKFEQDGPITKPTASSQSNTRRIIPNSKDSQLPKTEAKIEKTRAERWKITGVVALSECQLTVQAKSDFFFNFLRRSSNR
jgi:hypothetical protein